MRDHSGLPATEFKQRRVQLFDNLPDDSALIVRTLFRYCSNSKSIIV